VGGEIDLDRSLLASASADELLLEPLDQTAAAELEHVVPCLAALKRLIIDLPDEVDHDEIAFIGRPFDALDARKRFAEALDLAIDRLRRDIRLPSADLETLVPAELRLRRHRHLDREAERLACGRQFAQIEIRVRDRLDVCFEDRLLVPLGEGISDRLLEHGLSA